MKKTARSALLFTIFSFWISGAVREITAIASSEHWQVNGYSSGEIEVLHQKTRNTLASGSSGPVRMLAIFEDRYLAVGQGHSTTVFDLTNPGVPWSQQDGLLQGTAMKHEYHVALGMNGQETALLFYTAWKGPAAFAFPLAAPMRISGCQFSPATYDGYDERFVVVALATDESPAPKPAAHAPKPAAHAPKPAAPAPKPAAPAPKPAAQLIRMFDLVDRKEVTEFNSQPLSELGYWSKSGNAYEDPRPNFGVPRERWPIARRFYLQMHAWEAVRPVPYSR